MKESFFTAYPQTNPSTYPEAIISIIEVNDFIHDGHDSDFRVFEVQDQSLIEPCYFIFVAADLESVSVTSINEQGNVTVSDLVVLGSRVRVPPMKKASTMYSWGADDVATVLLDLLGSSMEYVILRLSGVDPEQTVVGDPFRDDANFRDKDPGATFTPQAADRVVTNQDVGQGWDTIITRNLNDYQSDGWPSTLAW